MILLELQWLTMYAILTKIITTGRTEFVLLDVVAQFGHNLAYRVDVNARNNF